MIVLNETTMVKRKQSLLKNSRFLHLNIKNKANNNVGRGKGRGRGRGGRS